MFQYLKTLFVARKGEKGQDLAEYALLIGLIALVVVLAVTFLGEQISITFQEIGDIVASWAVPP
jgi:pilus assembly protein Flp/PilA